MWLKHQVAKDCGLLRWLIKHWFTSWEYLPERRKLSEKNWVKAKRMYTNTISGKISIFLLLLIGCCHVWSAYKFSKTQKGHTWNDTLLTTAILPFFLVFSSVFSFCCVSQEMIHCFPVCSAPSFPPDSSTPLLQRWALPRFQITLSL